MDITEKTDILSKTLIFQNLSKDDLGTLALQFKKLTLNPQCIVKQGDKAHSFYIIVEGMAEVHILGKNNDDQLITTLKEFDTIGYVIPDEELDKDRLCNATVIGITPITLLVVTNDALRAFVKTKPEIAHNLLEQRLFFEKCNFIKLSGPFMDFPNDKIVQLAHSITQITVPEGTQIIQQGDLGNECYLIQKGSMDILICDEHGTTKKIGFLEEGEIFGELAMFEGNRRNATVISTSVSTLLVLSRNVFLKMMETSSHMAHSISHLAKYRNRPERITEITVATRQNTLGDTLYIIKNNRNQSYIQLSEEGWFIWEQLDGNTSIEELVLAQLQKLNRWDPEAITSLIIDLDKIGLITGPSFKQSVSNQPLKYKIYNRIKSVMECSVSIKNADHCMTQLYSRGGFLLFRWPTQIFLLLTIITGLILFIMGAETIFSDYSSNPYSYLYLIYVFPMTFITIPVHELAHGLTSKYFGREVHQFGFGWYWISAIAYCDTSDMWLASPKQRIIVNLAGIYADLCMAGISSIIAYFIANPTACIILWLFSALSYLNCLTNLNTFYEFDGYYILEDLLDEPGLRIEAFMWIDNLFQGANSSTGTYNSRKCILFWLVYLGYLALIIVSILFFQKHVLFNFLPQDYFLKHNNFARLIIPIIMMILSILTVRSQIQQKKQRYS